MFSLLADWTEAERQALRELGVDRERKEDFTVKRFGNIETSALLKSATAKRLHIHNTPYAEDVWDNLRRLAKFLNLVEANCHCLLTITSGYRSPSLNTAVGGSKKSTHLSGCAADIRSGELTNKELASLCLDLGADRVILENLSFRGWVHVEIPKAGKQPRGRKLTAYKKQGRGKVRYVAGLHNTGRFAFNV